MPQNQYVSTRSKHKQSMYVYAHIPKPLFTPLRIISGCSGGSVVENPAANAGDIKRCRFDPRVRKIPWRRAWQPTIVLLPGESHGQRRLAGSSPWVPKSQTRLTWLSISRAREGTTGHLDLIPGSGRSNRGGNGNPRQSSCQDNPTDRGAWQAKVHGVAKSQTQRTDWSTVWTTEKLHLKIWHLVYHGIFCINVDFFTCTDAKSWG